MLKRLLSEVFGKRAEPKQDGANAIRAGAAPLADGLAQAEAARKRGELALAEPAFRRILAREPGEAEAWLGLGLCAFGAGQLHQAHIYIRTASSVRPRDADILNELGMVESAMGNVSCAQATFESAVNMNPHHPHAWNNLGLTHAARGRVRQARRCFLRAISIRADFYTALCNLGLACQQMELAEEAERYLRRAIEAKPQAATAWLNLGSLLMELGRLEESRSAHERALAAAPRDPDIVMAFASMLYRLGEPAESERRFREALELAPGHAEAGLGLAQVLLARGEFAAGWDLYRWRLKSTNSVAKAYPYPEWQGEPLQGRRVLVYGEQGIGDEIMFASCLPEALRDARQVVFACNPRLQRLFERSFAGIALLGEKEGWNPGLESDLQGIDFCLPVGSLSQLYRRSRASFTAHQGYLKPDPARVAHFRGRLAALGPGRSLALSWRGGRASTGREARSLELEELAPILQLPGVHWISLQHDATPEELERAARLGARLHHWPEVLGELDETAALVGALEGAVTVCGTLVHLAGALGTPTWVLTPQPPAWRYMLEGETLPWYPAVRLYRQEVPGDWQANIRRLAGDLGRRAA